MNLVESHPDCTHDASQHFSSNHQRGDSFAGQPDPGIIVHCGKVPLELAGKMRHERIDQHLTVGSCYVSPLHIADAQHLVDDRL